MTKKRNGLSFMMGDILKEAVKLVRYHLHNKGLISLYVAGSYITEDKTPESDIDLFGIVKSDFKFKYERLINRRFRSLDCEREVRFRAVPICSLDGGEQKGVVRIFTPERMIKRFPFYKHVWGEDIDFSNFPVKKIL